MKPEFYAQFLITKVASSEKGTISVSPSGVSIITVAQCDIMED